MSNLEIYDKLRDMHKILLDILNRLDMRFNTTWELDALKTLDGVLYLTESVFAKDGNTERSIGNE